MPKIDNKKFYSSAIELYGTTAKGVNWHSSASQKLRFKIISEILPKEMHPYSLLDAGCGFADLYTYLEKKNQLPKKYKGVDALEDMCIIAANNTGCEIEVINLIDDLPPTSDFIVCSGALNTLTRDETLRFITHCFSASKKAFIFNILYGDKESETYNYFNKADIKLIADALGVKELILRDEYLEDDITVGFFK